MITEVTKDIIKKVYPERPQESRKYDLGLLLVIGGSEFYSGSPALSALAAFRAGVDMVRIIAPKRAADIIASFTPDLAAYPLNGEFLQGSHLATLITQIESAKTVASGKVAVVIGGGIGRTKETQRVVLDFLQKVSVPVVVDADAIHALSKNEGIISNKPFLLTPHTYEFFILTGKEVYKISSYEEKAKIVQEEAKRLGTTILLKGRTDIISDGENVAFNKTGGPFLAVGGTGDTLAGIAGALLARGVSPFEAGQAAAYLNGLAGEIAGKEFGDSLMATDLINSIVKAIKS
jgi:NAD(P)H-hydrate epimerase